MMSHIIGEAIFDITFGPEKQGEDLESNLARMVQARLLPVIEEVFDEMALDREAVRIDRLELDLGPVRDDELESELAARLREKLRDALRDYVLAREKTVVAGSAAISRRPADLEKLAYFLRYGHLTWNTSVGQSGSVVELLEEALLQSPAQIALLFEGGADFDTVVFRLASQFPENAVRDLVDRLARADPALASKVAAALRIQKGEAAAGAPGRSDEQSVVRAYELYDQLRRRLEGEAHDAADLGPLIEELQRKYPWQLLRLYRELQAGEGQSVRIPEFYGIEDLMRLVDAFLSVAEDNTHSIDDFKQSIQLFADKSADRKAYYTHVLHRLIRNEVLDLEELSTHSAPAAGSRVGADEDIQSLLTGRPERAREWFKQVAADPLALHSMIERLPERWLLRLLRLFQESSTDRVLQAADAVIESAYAAGMKLSYAKVALLKWEFILSAAVSEGRSLEKERFIDELGQLISGDVPQESRGLFLSQLRDAPMVAGAQTPLSWDVLIRAYDLYDIVLQQLGPKAQGVGSRAIRTALEELLQKYPLHVRRLYREVQADAGLFIRIQQTLSLEDLAGFLEVFLTGIYPGRAQSTMLWKAIAQGAVLSEDPRRYYGQVLRRLLLTPGADVDTLVAEPSAEESDQQVFEGMRLLLEGRADAIQGEDLVRRFEAILRDRPERAQLWLLEALSSEQTSEAAPGVSPGVTTTSAAISPRAVGRGDPSSREGAAIHLLGERVLLEVFRQFGGGRLAVLIQTADAVADALLTGSAPISERELARLKWAFLFRYAIEGGSDSDPAVFSAAFAGHLEEHILSVSERVRRIQLKLWDRAQPLNEPFLIQTLGSLGSPPVERLLVAADAVAHTFYRAGLALPQSEIARLKWQLIFSDTLLEEADRHTDEFSSDFEALLRHRLAEAERVSRPLEEGGLRDGPRADAQTGWSGFESSFGGGPLQLEWSEWVRAYELYDLLRRSLVDGKPHSASALIAALEETLRLHPWQLLRLYREMQAGDGISARLKDLYRADELRRLAEGLLTVSVEHPDTSSAILEAITAFEPHEVEDGDLRVYYFDVLVGLVQVGRPPVVATNLSSASLPDKVRWIQARLKDRARPLPERFLVHVLSEMDSPAVRRLLQTADSITDAYYRAGLALPHGEVARLKWEMLFSDALLEETETHAAEFAEHFQVLIRGRLGAETGSPASAPLAAPLPVLASAELGWTSWARAYELYDRLRRILVDGEPDSASGFMAHLDETLQLYPWQLLRLYREMQTDGLSVRFKDFLGAEELRRVVEALLAVSEEHPTATADAMVAISAFEPEAANLRFYYADVLEQLVQTRRPPGSAMEFIAAPLPEKVRRIQAMLRDRSRPLSERVLVQVLREIESPAIDRLLRTADAVADAYYRGAAVLPQREIARLKWELIFSDMLLEEPELHADEFADHFRFLLDERVDSVGRGQLPVSPFLESGWSVWIRAYELYDRLRRVLVEDKPDSASGLMAALEEVLRLHPWQLLRLYREMQAGDGLSVRVKTLYGAGELQRIVEAFLTVSEVEAGAFDGLKKSMVAFAQQSKDQRLYYAALLQQLVRAEAIDLDLALTLSGEEHAEGQLLEASGEWRDVARSYELYENLRRALLGTGAVRAAVKELVEELAQSYPWQIRKLYRELESTALQAGILRSRDAGALRSLIDAFARVVRLEPALAAAIEQELATGTPDDAVQRYSRVLEMLIRARVKESESTAPTRLSPQPSAQGEGSRELVFIAEDALRGGAERLQKWIEEMFSSATAAERLVRLLPEGLIARILITGAPSSSPALLLVTAERLAMAASTALVGLSPRRARELKWMFVLRYGIVEKHTFVESQFLRSFAAFVHSETPLPSVEGLTAALAGQMKVDGMSLLVRQEEDKTFGAIELERGISVLNAGMVLAAPYLPKLFAELNLTEGRKFRSDEDRERAVHLLQYMVTESEDTAEHELVLNKILCGMDTSAPVRRRIELVDREKVMIESLIQGMILNWKKLGQTSVAGFRESFLQREGTLRLTDDAWQLEVFPRAFDMLLDYIPWTFETIKHPWMEHIVHVKWR